MSSSPVICLEKKLIRSPAWLSLRGASMQVYLIFRIKCRMEEIKMPGKPHKRWPEWQITNNGEITFSYKEAQTKFGFTASRFVRAIDDLIAKGFLDITESGMGVHRLTTLYSISDRWRRYGKSDFEVMTRKKSGFKPGFREKTSRENDSDTTRVCVSDKTFLVLRTDRDGKVQKTAFKFRNGQCLETKTA